jgi:hypothetical protein
MAALAALASLANPDTSCTPMTNTYNAQYNSGIQIGSQSQTLQVIPDSGSFALVIPSTLCETNACHSHTRFDYKESDTFNPNPIDMTKTTPLAYGQGTVEAIIGYDDVSVGGMTAEGQGLNLMYDEDIKGFEGSAFDGIMGLGKNSDAQGSDSGAGDEALLSTMKQGAFGVCLGQGDGDDGRLDLASQKTDLPSIYDATGSNSAKLTSIGDYHWGMRLSGMGVRDSAGDTFLKGAEGYGCTKAEQMTGACKATDGCDSGSNCAAVIDTGTSLMLLADENYYSLLTLIEDTAPGKMDELFEESNCDNAHALPDVILTLGEEKKTLAISPSVYMVVMPIGVGTGLKEWRSTKAANLTNAAVKPEHSEVPWPYSDRCVDVFSPMGARLITSGNGLMYILGMPMFRQFAVAFDRASSPHSISFANVKGTHTCASCSGSSEEMVATGKPTADGSLQPPQIEERRNATGGVRIDPSKLRYPSRHKFKTKEGGFVHF